MFKLPKVAFYFLCTQLLLYKISGSMSLFGYKCWWMHELERNTSAQIFVYNITCRPFAWKNWWAKYFSLFMACILKAKFFWAIASEFTQNLTDAWSTSCWKVLLHFRIQKKEKQRSGNKELPKNMCTFFNPFFPLNLNPPVLCFIKVI